MQQCGLLHRSPDVSWFLPLWTIDSHLKAQWCQRCWGWILPSCQLSTAPHEKLCSEVRLHRLWVEAVKKSYYFSEMCPGIAMKICNSCPPGGNPKLTVLSLSPLLHRLPLPGMSFLLLNHLVDPCSLCSTQLQQDHIPLPFPDPSWPLASSFMIPTFPCRSESLPEAL